MSRPEGRRRRAWPILAGMSAVALAAGWAQTHPNRPMLELSEASTVPCGPTPGGTYARHPWVIRNVGAEPLRIRTRFTSGRSGFSLWQGQEHVVMPGGRLLVHLTWVAPSRESSPFSSFATLRTNDPTRPVIRLVVVGRSGPPPVSPGPVAPR